MIAAQKNAPHTSFGIAAQTGKSGFRLVTSVCFHISGPVGVALKARMVGIFLISVAAAGCMAGYAVQIALFSAGVHHPVGHGIIFAQRTAVGIKVVVFERGKIVIIKKFIAGNVAGSYRAHFGMAG
jgi:hypothetical protein